MIDQKLNAAQKHTYEVMCPEDPRWETIFASASTILTKYHGPLPPGPVSELCVMFIIRVPRADGYTETVYFANKQDVVRWHSATGNVKQKLDKMYDDGTVAYEHVAIANPEWTVAQILDSVGA